MGGFPDKDNVEDGWQRYCSLQGFPEAFTDQDLYNFFALHGHVISARVVRGLREESLRYGFVEIASEEEAV